MARDADQTAEQPTSEQSVTMPPRGKHWCFTLNNYTDIDYSRLCDAVDDYEDCDYIVFGKEVGESGTPHLQGFVSFSRRKLLGAVISVLGQCHLEFARDVPRAIEYCKKDGDFVEFGEPPKGRKPVNESMAEIFEAFKTDVKAGVLTFEQLFDKHTIAFVRGDNYCRTYYNTHSPAPSVDGHPLRRWQQQLYDRLQLPAHKRQVTFVVDPVGNSGKSWFARYYLDLHPSSTIILKPMRTADMNFLLRRDMRVLFLDAPRAKQGEYIQYDFLENVKDGVVLSGKYTPEVKRMKHVVHVVVFMNERPDMSALSRDRYDIWDLSEMTGPNEVPQLEPDRNVRPRLQED